MGNKLVKINHNFDNGNRSVDVAPDMTSMYNPMKDINTKAVASLASTRKTEGNNKEDISKNAG